MSDKKVNQLTSLTDVEFNDDTRQFPVGDAGTGLLKSGTVAQCKLIFGTHAIKYTASGSEGTTLTIPTLSGKDILVILRESGPVYEAVSSPTPAEYTWNLTNIVFGTALGVNERLVIFWKYF